MERYFHIRYEFSREAVRRKIDETLAAEKKGYICVADGVILSLVQHDLAYRKVIDEALFSICDSSWVPLYIRWIYGRQRKQYCGSQIFEELISLGRYRMMFLGTSRKVLDPLKENLSHIDPRVADMPFVELPFCSAETFDYVNIGRMIDEYAPDIVWVALGAPKQEKFMNYLLPHIRRGVMIAVGAAFNFHSGGTIRRAPEWVVKCHMEFLWRIFSEPRKQLKRCKGILTTMPRMLWDEWRRKRQETKKEKK